MYQIVETTHQQKMTMYMKCTKKKLAEMLIACNDALDFQNKNKEFPNEQSYKTLSGSCHCCPVCDGKGIVPNGFYASVCGFGTTTSTIPETCRSCSGNGFI